jgi:IS30 family transposase
LARTYRHLDVDERRILFRMVEARTPVGEIAQRLGRHPSTLYRELGATASVTATEGSAATSR